MVVLGRRGICGVGGVEGGLEGWSGWVRTEGSISRCGRGNASSGRRVVIKSDNRSAVLREDEFTARFSVDARERT